jgi:hypothetical protein
MAIDKANVARRQLGTALALFIEDQDPVSVHVLACGGGEVAEQLARQAEQEPFATEIMTTFNDLKIQDIRRIRNQFWNAFKHATTLAGTARADTELLASFGDQQNEHALFIGWYDYMMAVNQLPVEAQVFQIWYYALYPEKLAPEVSSEVYTDLFPAMKAIDRTEQKRRLRDVIVWAKQQPDCVDHDQTDNTPLILPLPSS